MTNKKKLSQKSNNLAFVIGYAESAISDEGRILLFICYLRFFTTFHFIQNDTFETAALLLYPIIGFSQNVFVFNVFCHESANKKD